MAMRLRDTFSKIKLEPEDLQTFSSAYFLLRQFTIGYCTAIMADNCCCHRRKRSIKLYKSGQEQVDKRLDIVRLIRL